MKELVIGGISVLIGAGIASLINLLRKKSSSTLSIDQAHIEKIEARTNERLQDIKSQEKPLASKEDVLQELNRYRDPD